MSANERLPRWLSRCLLVGLLAMAVYALASPSNKWRIQASGDSRGGGEVELSFTQRGGPATTLTVAIPARTGENQAARLIRDAIRGQFGAVYHAEVDDGEDVLVKAAGGTPDFDLVIVRNTATGLRLNLDRE